jgi:hypothetical protein
MDLQYRSEISVLIVIACFLQRISVLSIARNVIFIFVRHAAINETSTKNFSPQHSQLIHMELYHNYHAHNFCQVQRRVLPHTFRGSTAPQLGQGWPHLCRQA